MKPAMRAVGILPPAGAGAAQQPLLPYSPPRRYNAPVSSPALLAAKFHRPAAPRYAVPRPALVARLNDGLAAGRLLTLIAAPAGYGKTTLAALQRVHPAVGAELLPALLAGQLPPPAALVTALLNDLDAARSTNPAGPGLVCVLDDFHTIQDAAILAALQGLLALRSNFT